jgi:leader peptidase (prepilin peptidase) / N-methyltransferase
VLIAVAVSSMVVGFAVGWRTPWACRRFYEKDLKVPPLFPAIATAIVMAITTFAIGLNWALPAFLWLMAFGSMLTFIDLELHRLPDKFTFSAAIGAGVLLLLPAIAYGEWALYGRAWLGSLVMGVSYFVMCLIYPKGMGIGDVKLAFGLGLGLGYLGWSFVIVGYLAAFCLGAIVSIGLIVAARAGLKTMIPFGPFMIAGALLAFLVAPDVMDWYLSRALG